MEYKLSNLVDLTLQEYYISNELERDVDGWYYNTAFPVYEHYHKLKTLLVMEICHVDKERAKEIVDRLEMRASDEYFKVQDGERYEFINRLVKEEHFGTKD